MRLATELKEGFAKPCAHAGDKAKERLEKVVVDKWVEPVTGFNLEMATIKEKLPSSFGWKSSSG